MAERITNDHREFMAQVKTELVSPAHRDAEKTALLFLVWPALLFEFYAIHYIKGEPGRLLLRRWNHNYDLKRFSLGVYNQDRIAIDESTFPLTSEQSAELDRMISADHPVKEHKGIILDGVDFSLQIWSNDKDLAIEWRTHSQISDDTKQLIDFLFKTTGTKAWGDDLL